MYDVNLNRHLNVYVEMDHKTEISECFEDLPLVEHKKRLSMHGLDEAG